jgi:hypothetical protein
MSTEKKLHPVVQQQSDEDNVGVVDWTIEEETKAKRK